MKPMGLEKMECRAKIRHAVLRAMLFSLLWWGVAGGEEGSWVIGVPSVALATLISLASGKPAPWQWRPMGIIRFIPFFLWHSLRGGLDVAWRALRPRLSLDPSLVYHPLRLPEGPARIFLINTVNLLPGTLSAELQNGQLTIHMLDATLPAIRDLHLLEVRIAVLFGLELTE